MLNNFVAEMRLAWAVFLAARAKIKRAREIVDKIKAEGRARAAVVRLAGDVRDAKQQAGALASIVESAAHSV